MNINQAIKRAKQLLNSIQFEEDREALIVLINLARLHQRQEKAKLSVSWKSRNKCQ